MPSYGQWKTVVVWILFLVSQNLPKVPKYGNLQPCEKFLKVKIVCRLKVSSSAQILLLFTDELFTAKVCKIITKDSRNSLTTKKYM